MLFAGTGYQVSLYDVLPAQVSSALEDIREQLIKLQTSGLLRGDLNAEQQAALITGVNDIHECVKGAKHIQECVPESLDLKKKVFTQLDGLVSPSTVLCSSTSCIVPSKFSEELVNRKNVIVAHPVNPPYYVPAVEVIPAPWTDPEVVSRTRALLVETGQSPVVLNKEVPGFLLNRIQYAILNECWRLVESGVCSVKDIDTVMSAGLGRRYAFIGPLETAHLNAEGMMSYCERYGQTIYNVSQEFGPVPKMEGAAAENITKQLFEMVPENQMQERRAWRDRRLAALAKLNKDMEGT